MRLPGKASRASDTMVGSPACEQLLKTASGASEPCLSSTTRVSQMHVRCDGGHAVGRGGGEPVRKAREQPRRDADVVRRGGPSLGGPTGLAAGGAQVQRRAIVAREEGAHAVGVVVVRVGEHGRVHLREVDAQCVSVLCKGVRLAEVQKQLQPTMDQVQ